MTKLYPLQAATLLITISFLTSNGCNSFREPDNSSGITVTINKARAVPGDTIYFSVSPESLKDFGLTEIYLLKPAGGQEKLLSEPENSDNNILKGKIVLAKDCQDGFYVITAIHKRNGRITSGKASFLKGKVVLDYAIMSNFADSGTMRDMEEYLIRFVGAGGNALTLHANMAAEKVWGGSSRIRAVWASRVCKNAVDNNGDRLEMMLNLTDKIGIPSFISVSWDLTDSTITNTEYMKSIHDITDELWRMFGHHTSLIGFYSYQEGSGTYFASYIREFCSIAKQNNPGLLTMCAPNIDDPLLAGYLAAIDDLDVINFQAPVMTSYRPDNRKLFPNRRVRDVTSLSAGATRIRDKITLSHVEFMGYLENNVGGAYLTDYRNIFNQFPSVASAYGTDGITFFSYYSCIYFNSAKLPAEAGIAAEAVGNGLKAYMLISKEIAMTSGHIAFYVPYNDWCIERWTNCFLPATDALCRLGISPDIIPFIPKKGEEILPFYPMHKNEEQLKFLLDNKYILILPDISGMQETDSEMLESFVRNGGTVFAFGPRIPYGDRFNRNEFWGAGEISAIRENSVFNAFKIIRSPGKRTKQQQIISFDPVISTSWDPPAANRIADFSNGTGAVFSNSYHKGKTYVISLSLKDAVNNFPDLLRDLFDEALSFYEIKRPFDLYGIIDNMDVAMNENNAQYSLMVANYNKDPLTVTVKPLVKDWPQNYTITDMKSGNNISPGPLSGSETFRIEIDPDNYIALKLIPDDQLK